MAFSITFAGTRFQTRTSTEWLIYYPPDHPNYGRSRIEWTSPTYGSVPIESGDAERAIATGAVTLFSTARTGARKYLPTADAPPELARPKKPRFRDLDLEEID